MNTIEDFRAQYPGIEINLDGNEDSYREDLPIVEREPIAVVIKHPIEASYLLAVWKGVTWNGLLTGGIEKDDTMEQTVRKEIHEEAGYKNVAKIIPLDFIAHALFFHPVKNVNRLAHYHLVYAELADLEKDEVSEEEKAIADFVWVPEDEVATTITRKAMKQLWQFYTEQEQRPT